MNSTIQTKGVSLVNVSAVTMSSVDERILNDIQSSSMDVVLNRAAHNEAVSKDYFYRVMVHVSIGKGFTTLPSDARGKFPSLSESFKSELNVVSVETDNSQRKYYSQVAQYCWAVAQLGYNPLQFPSFSSLKKVARPKKEMSVKFEQDSINSEVIDAYNASKVAEQESKSRAIEAAKVAEQEAQAARLAEQEAQEQRAIMQSQVDAIRADIKALREALNSALYGTADQRKALRAAYPKA